jgi:DNA-binding FrmR family transcriptional regulator
LLDNTKKRNQRVAASLRRIQAQVAAIERSLAEDPDGGMLLQRVAAARTAMSGLTTYLMKRGCVVCSRIVTAVTPWKK